MLVLALREKSRRHLFYRQFMVATHLIFTDKLQVGGMGKLI